MKTTALLFVLCFSLFACDKEGAKRRMSNAEQMAQEKATKKYLWSLQGGVYRCHFPTMESRIGHIQIYLPHLSFHFRNTRHWWGNDGDNNHVYFFNVTNYSDVEVGAFQEIEEPWETKLEVAFNKLEGFGTIKGFPELPNGEISFNSCTKIK